LRLLTEARPRIAVLNAGDPLLAALELPGSQVRWFGRGDGWHLRGDALHRGDTWVMDTTLLPLPGRHNRGNLCAVLTAIDALGLDAIALAPHAASFRPLPHRLQTLGVRGGITYVNDSISTTPHASLAALELFRDRRVAILVGGHDRGVDWQAFADAMDTQAPVAIITMGENGPRIHALLAPIAVPSDFVLAAADDLADAMHKACAVLGNDGVLLLSPGAPSFGPYRDYVARGRHFAELAGFDPDMISTIPGLGIS
jgi:UDP-N-acetylmuramoylalanine--D-glutamate ligase